MYKHVIKRLIDICLSFLGIVVLALPMGLVALIIKIEDPGPAIFKQKRIGIHKKTFMLYKFRSMKMDTPHDMPTHLLENPEQYILKSGKFIRTMSIDELPQLFNILKGDMSIIGPRPALWNQDDLVAERDKYGANDIKPGLTGWAQINGRDELEIPDKARLDGEYVERESFAFDVKCFLGTITSVLKHEGVVEGGTGELKKIHTVENEQPSVSKPTREKKILIVGEGSYIGDFLKEYLTEYSPLYQVSTLNAIGLVPEPEQFAGFDDVVVVAGIAHRKETRENRKLYYQVNRDLVVSVAKASRKAKVPHLTLLSSMSVYGLEQGHITKETAEAPKNAYGNSKLQADRALRYMASPEVKAAILRPPMVYGKGCKGNYQTLRKIALKVPVFPDVKNERSMIYIGNLCEFIRETIDLEREGIFFPQNCEYVNTAEFIRLIAMNHGKKVRLIPVPGKLFKKIPAGAARKAFGDLTYEKTDAVSRYSFVESVSLTEQE